MLIALTVFCVITGELNRHLDNKSTVDATRFNRGLCRFELKQHATDTVHKRGYNCRCSNIKGAKLYCARHSGLYVTFVLVMTRAIIWLYS